MSTNKETRDLRRFFAWLKFVLKAERIGRFMAYAAQRFARDGGARQAAGLSYASLLAIVPLLAVGLSFLAGFPAFEHWRFELQRFVFDSMLPDVGLEVSDYLATFIENAKRMTAPGMVGLAVTAVLLMSNINGAMNQIWRVSEPRPIVSRLMVYWTILTLGPLFIGASLSISSYAFAAVQWFDSAALGGSLGLTRLASVALSALGFALIYVVVPNRLVHPGHALAGGLVAALLFELLKYGFGLYLKYFPSYQAVYGAVSAIPIFLIWMYLSWCVILFGAQVAAALPEWRASQARGSRTADPGTRMALALSILARLREASRNGTHMKERHLGRQLPATPAELDATLRAMRAANLIERGRGSRWVLCRDLDEVTMGDLADALDLGLAPGHGWHPSAEVAVAALHDSLKEVRARPISQVLEEGDAEAGRQTIAETPEAKDTSAARRRA
jgi:membrane protein